MHKQIRIATIAITSLLVSLIVPMGAATAGTPANYAEYPYAATDYNEAFRGQFHFSSQNGWMNDVNAPLYYNGQYHLFYQHNPHGLGWDTMHWGHATSTDMVHWQQKAIALEPGVHNATLFSGGGWVDTNNVTGLKGSGQTPIILFTNTNGVSIAYSNDGGNRFQMYDGGNKVITTAYESRDPKVFWDSARNRWGMALWANDGGNTVKFYSSTNLLTWTARGEFRAPWFFECPDIFQLPVDGNTGNQKWVITDASGEYTIGSLNSSGVFVQDSGFPAPQLMDQGRGAFDGSFYAGLTFTNLPTSRVVQMYWQPGNKGSTWTGNASFPAELGLKTYPEGIRTTRQPIAELATLRSDSQSWASRTITTSDTSDPLNGINADTYELIAEWDLMGATATEFGFRLHQRADGSSDRTIAYNRPQQQMELKPLAPINGKITMRILVDRGQIEAFGNGGKFSLTEVTNFNSALSSQGISAYAIGGNVTLVSLTFHRLNKAFTAQPNGAGVTAGPIRWNGSSKCLDRDSNGSVNIWDCNGYAHQSWIYDSVNGQLKVGGNCLDQPLENINNGAQINAWTCNQQAQQSWTRIGDNQFRNNWSGRCLDLAHGDATNGRRLQVWDCVGGPNQRFTLPGA